MKISFVKKSEILQRFKISHPSLYRKCKDGGFPKPIKLMDAKASAWLESEVESMACAIAAGLSGEELKKFVAELEAKRRNLLKDHLADTASKDSQLETKRDDQLTVADLA